MATHPLPPADPLSAPGHTWLWTAERSLPSETGAARSALMEVIERLRADGWPLADIFAVHLALEEGLVNAVRHGNRFDPAKKVTMRCRLALDRIEIEIADEGPGFNPAEVPDCMSPEMVERPSGRGIMLMKSFMTRVAYVGCGNRLILEKARSQPLA